MYILTHYKSSGATHYQHPVIFGPVYLFFPFTEAVLISPGFTHMYMSAFKEASGNYICSNQSHHAAPHLSKPGGKKKTLCLTIKAVANRAVGRMSLQQQQLERS